MEKCKDWNIGHITLMKEKERQQKSYSQLIMTSGRTISTDCGREESGYACLNKQWHGCITSSTGIHSPIGVWVGLGSASIVGEDISLVVAGLGVTLAVDMIVEVGINSLTASR